MDRRSRLEAGYTWVRTRPFEADALGAALLAGLLVLLPALGHLSAGSPLLSLALIVPLAWRRTQPLACAGVIAAIGVAQIVEGIGPVPADVAVLLALYALAAYGPRWAGAAGLMLAFFGILAEGVRLYELPAQHGYLVVRGLSSLPVRLLPLLAGFVAMLVLSTWALGTLRRLRFREEERLTERARLLERERDQESRLAAAGERARIAREMHDVVAHSLSVTISQADGGQYAARSDPQAAIAALHTIAVTGRQALADMRALLGVLRQDEPQALVPQPDTNAIPELVEQVAGGGLDVRLEVVGRARELPPGPGLAAYRIVQESLTNVLKHAGPGIRARVRLDWQRDLLDIWVVDDGRGAAAAVAGGPGGQGLLGMRERATLHGGRLEAGPQPGGGFGVHAVLPYGRGSARQ